VPYDCLLNEVIPAQDRACPDPSIPLFPCARVLSLLDGIRISPSDLPSATRGLLLVGRSESGAWTACAGRRERQRCSVGRWEAVPSDEAVESETLLLAPLVATAAIAGIAIASSHGAETRFDCDAYRFDANVRLSRSSSVGETPTARQRLADGLIACNTLDEVSVREARTLLGRPDERDEEGLAYQLGPERHPAHIDSEYLDVAVSDGRRRSRLSRTAP
jgi:hypothetical protein